MKHHIDVLQQLLENIKQIPDYATDGSSLDEHNEMLMNTDVFTLIVIVDHYRQLIHECQIRMEYIQGLFNINPND